VYNSDTSSAATVIAENILDCIKVRDDVVLAFAGEQLTIPGQISTEHFRLELWEASRELSDKAK
jgi:hypothetical protein